MKKIIFFFIAIFITLYSKAQFVKTTAVAGLSYPVAFDWMPNGNYLITLKGGSAFPAANAKIQVYSPTGLFLNTFYNLTDSTDADFERGLLGVCVDPNFSVNHYVYAYYNHNFNGDERIRVIRFTETANIGTNPTMILDIDVSNSIAGNHVAGNVHMHASEPDMLYVVIGDVAVSSNAQLLTNPYGKVLRIHTDGTIPATNPFYDDGNPLTLQDDRIWSYGHRNPFDFCFSPVNDGLYVAENGLNTWDEANLILPGHNYGWNSCEGNFLINSSSSPCTNPAFTPPIATWHSPVPSVTGIMVYSGTVFPQLDNHLLVADNNVGNIHDCVLGNAPAYDTVTSNTVLLNVMAGAGLTTIRQGTDGCIYAMRGGYTTAGAIYRLCPPGLDVNEISTPVQYASVIPNPSSSGADLYITLSSAEHVTIDMNDITGRKISTVFSGNLAAKNHVLHFETSGLSNGNYLLNIRLSNQVKVLKIVVIKE
ncbi:MAG: PQQ-dependent sugar dehydrogenase [Bacteroidia bacterium]